MNTIKGGYDERHWWGPVTIDGRPLTPDESFGLAMHSPDGFAWGYTGSGPAQLALAILLACHVPGLMALQWYHAFCFEFVSRLPRSGFVLRVDVAAWVAMKESAISTARETGELARFEKVEHSITRA